MRLLRKKRTPERWPQMMVHVNGYCTECGRPLDEVHGTVVGHVEGMCPEHGHIHDALTA